MTLTFSRYQTPKRFEELDALAQLRAALLWTLTGMDEWPTVDHVLRSTGFRRFVLRDDDGRATAEWWMFEDAGLLFSALDVVPVGHAIQHGFVCADADLARAIASARRAPSQIDWTSGASDAPAARLADAASVAAALRDAIAARRASAEGDAANAKKSRARRGASRASVTPKKEAPPSPPAPGVEKEAYVAGEAVHVRYRGEWSDGRIEQVMEPGVYRISYDGYGPEWHETVRADRVRGR